MPWKLRLLDVGQLLWRTSQSDEKCPERTECCLFVALAQVSRTATLTLDTVAVPRRSFVPRWESWQNAKMPPQKKEKKNRYIVVKLGDLF